MKIAIILGTRPEIIKMSPIIRECQKQRLNFFILNTNQHYVENLNKSFFKQLNLPRPKYNLNIGSGSHAEETGKMLIKIERILIKEKPVVVLVEGDTNTVISGTLAAVKIGIRVGHIEAGLRSYDRNMPEELNRIVVDHLSEYLFAPTKQSEEILIREGIPKEKIFVTGNTIVDAVYQNLKIAERSSNILRQLNLKEKNYFLFTLHRQENVDKKERLKWFLISLGLIYKEFKLPIIYPIHPRTQKRIEEFRLKVSKRIKLIPPLSYFDFLKLEQNAKLILTDSGGIQEEACILKIPCVTLRTTTERPETLDIKANKLAGRDPGKILKTVKMMLNEKIDWINPFGDGKSAIKIIKILKKYL